MEDDQIDQVYGLIDTDNDGFIDKPEMEIFLKALVSLHDDLTFNALSSG